MEMGADQAELVVVEPSAGKAVGTSDTSKPPLDPLSEQKLLSVYKTMLSSLFVATLCFCAAIAALILIPYWVTGNDPSIALTVVFVGALGAFFSALTRLYNYEDLPKVFVVDPLKNISGRYLLIYSFVPAAIGAIAAIVIYLIFAAGLLDGPIFPAFKCKAATGVCESFLEFVDNVGPVDGPAYAKALIWAFIAGFAERLVPDTLRRLSQNMQEAKIASGQKGI